MNHFKKYWLIYTIVIIAIILFYDKIKDAIYNTSVEENPTASTEIILNENGVSSASRIASPISVLPSDLVSKIKSESRLTLQEATTISEVVPGIVYNSSTGGARKICCRSGTGVNVTVSIWSHLFGKGCEKAAGVCGDLFSS